ncbi:MAG: NADP-dependent malic enzyme [Nanoarchaeota archaeon]
MTIQEEALEMHKKFKGKLAVASKVPLQDRKDLSLAYTPGVAEPCRAIAIDKKKVYDYTIKGNAVAVISDGSAVLGLGNIGAEAGIPVMEGKAILFKEFAGIDAFPICLASQDVQKSIETIKNLAPIFGGINMEDFKAPECFEIEEALQNLGIPVMHDDQHGTAIVVTAALINSLKIVGKSIGDVKIVISGAGAAATGVSNLLISAGVSSGKIILCDRQGAIYNGRSDLGNNKYKLKIAKITNSLGVKGTLGDALVGADILIGLSSKGLVSSGMVVKMNQDAIVFAMANPEPEIMPDDALKAGAVIVATGRSDFPNQINNVLAFPGVFRGALDVRASSITKKMKLAAAYALAKVIESPSKEMLLPSPFDKKVVPAIADAVAKAWLDEHG